MEYRILPFGDSAVTVELGQEVSVDVNAKVALLASYFMKNKKIGITDLIPTYTSLTICFDNQKLDPKKLEMHVQKGLLQNTKQEKKLKRVHIIPVLYGGEYGEDLLDVAKYHDLTVEDVIRLHTSKDYLIYMIGFLPGFPYLGGLDTNLVTPRLDTPRTSIPAGSVGIGGKQTGIYPMASPGGWRLIGRTPYRLYDPKRSPSVPYTAGDYIRFVSISKEEYLKIETQVEMGTYIPLVEEVRL